MLWVFFLLFSKYFKKKKEKKKKNMRKKTHSPGQQTRHCFKTISVTVTVRTGVQWERERKEQRHWGQIGTLGATINQLYQSLMESSQWQNGNYSTGCVMLAWHLFCHWLLACPCGEQSTDQWEGKKEGRFRHRELALCNLLGFYSYSDANICHYNLIKTLPSLVQ